MELLTWAAGTGKDWLLVISVVILVLERLGILKPFPKWVDKILNHNLNRAKDREEFEQSEKARASVTKAMEAMQAPYNVTWLMEQTTLSTSAALDQLKAYQDFLQATVADNVKLIPAIMIKLQDLDELEEVRKELRKLEYTQAQTRDIVSLLCVEVSKLADVRIVEDDSELME